MISTVDRGRSVELHTIAFRKLDVTNCVHSYMIFSSVMIASNLPQPSSRLGLCQANSINSNQVLTQVYIVTTIIALFVTSSFQNVILALGSTLPSLIYSW